MLLKTHVEKMSVLATPTICMKTSNLSRDSHDIYETKGSCASEETDRKRGISLRRERKRPMSREGQPDLPNVRANEMNASVSSEGSTPEAGVSGAVTRLRQASNKKRYYVRSRNVYENKGTPDTMSERNRTFVSNFRAFLFNWCPFCRKVQILNDKLADQFGFSRASSCMIHLFQS